MNLIEFSYRSGDYLFRIDSTHAVISVNKNGSVIDNIPININREITREEFFKFVTDYTRKYC